MRNYGMVFRRYACDNTRTSERPHRAGMFTGVSLQAHDQQQYPAILVLILCYSGQAEDASGRCI
ncbi:hypothetical protein M404DRAFT_1004528 [Pisolithus tinctorius Marx 270]|uniref:Uncharacterized protein n=1 Tax=Pisolithus tinctorius Marx 270 TaxID=870435 RepID=A0A0C3IRN4_PISTI|nr:hypothetical protein M404DRAFT_1004528 [Pisolithus tinctorius Marx 270]